MRNSIQVKINPNTLVIDRKIFDREYISGVKESLFDTIERALINERIAHNLVRLGSVDEYLSMMVVYNEI